MFTDPVLFPGQGGGREKGKLVTVGMHTAVFPFSGGGIASESSRASAWQPVGKAVLCVIFQDGEEAAVASASVYFLASGECSALGRMPDPAA